MSTDAIFTHPVILELLKKLVHSTDDVRKKQPYIKLNTKTLPEFFQSDEPEFLWQGIEMLRLMGWIRIEHGRIAADQAVYEVNPRIYLEQTHLDAAKRLFPGKKTYAQQWLEAVAEIPDDAGINRQALAQLRIEIPGISPQTIIEAIISRNPSLRAPVYVHELSAHLFWGLAKVLRHRAELMAQVYGVDPAFILEPPIQLHVHLAGVLDGVLFVENQTSFHRLLHGAFPGFHRLALVYASGYKLSAERNRIPAQSRLFFSAASNPALMETFQRWLYDETLQTPCWFWGDLDFAAMHILKSLRKTFKTTQAWQPGYQILLQALPDLGHSPAMDKDSGKSQQSDPGHTGCLYADETLLPALRQHGKFIDQESYFFLASEGTAP